MTIPVSTKITLISQCSERHAELGAESVAPNSTIQHPVDYHGWGAMPYHKLQPKPTKCNTTDELATSSICSDFSYLPHLNKPTGSSEPPTDYR